LCRRRTALSPLSYGRLEEPPAGVEPAPRPYKVRVLAVDTTEAEGGDGRSRTDIFLVASEALVHLSYIPKGADGWSRTTTARGDRVPACGARRCSASAWREGWPAGFEPAPAGLTTPGASVYTTATTKRGRPDSNRRPLA